jgi:predicted porin
MNKKLIAAAIAAVVAAPAVSAADTTLYGKAHVSIQSNDNGAGDNYSVNSNASRLGVKGSEDLGDGLKAIFGYEMGYDITDGGANGPISARNAYVGLAGDWGTFLAGRHDTPAKIAFYAAGTDLLGDSIIDMNASGARVGFSEVRADNAIAYVSPSFSGFTVAAAIVPGEQSGVAAAASTNTVGVWTNGVTSATGGNVIGQTSGGKVVLDGNAGTGFPTYVGTTAVVTPGAKNGANNLADAYSLGLMYAGGGLKASLGYEVFGNDLFGGSPAKDQKMLQAGVSYTFGDFTIGGNYEDKKDVGGVANADLKVWGLAGKANFGNNFVIANYINSDPSAASSTDRYGLAVGHTFSKRTQVYAAYENQDNPTGTADTSAFSLGMIHSF